MIDAIDRALVDALSHDGRVRFNKVASIVGVSPQTVARRYRRLQEEASLRVVGQVRPSLAGRAQWLLRVTATPRVAQDLALVLRKRPDTSRLNITSGGSEIVCLIDTDASGSQYPLFLRELPNTEGVLGVDAHQILHVYLGGPSVWFGQVSELSDSQRDQIGTDGESAGSEAGSEAGSATSGGPGETRGSRGDREVVLDDVDHKILTTLHRDGRASLAELAERSGSSTVTVARRLDELRGSGVLFFDVDIDPSYLGAGVRTLLWMSVPPAQLDRIARVLATHQEPAFVASLTGSSNLMATGLTPDAEALHRYVTTELGQFPEISRLETSPVLRNLKASGGVGVDPGKTSANPAPTAKRRVPTIGH